MFLYDNMYQLCHKTRVHCITQRIFAPSNSVWP